MYRMYNWHCTAPGTKIHMCTAEAVAALFRRCKKKQKGKRNIERYSWKSTTCYTTTSRLSLHRARTRLSLSSCVGSWSWATASCSTCWSCRRAWRWDRGNFSPCREKTHGNRFGQPETNRSHTAHYIVYIAGTLHGCMTQECFSCSFVFTAVRPYIRGCNHRLPPFLAMQWLCESQVH